MVNEQDLEQLRRQLAKIPLVGAMQVELLEFQHGRMQLRAPLAANVNDKGSAFGGSLVSLMTLAGWALVTAQVQRVGRAAEVYVADSAVRYLAPVYGALHAQAWLEEGEWSTFLGTLAQRGRARCRIAAQIALPDGAEGTVLSGRFVAIATP